MPREKKPGGTDGSSAVPRLVQQMNNRLNRPGAIERLWNEHRRFIGAVLLAHAPAGADIEDLCQDVAVTMCDKLGSLRDENRLRPWLRSIAINIARDAARRTLKRRERSAGFPDDAADPNRTEGREQLDDVLRVVLGLPQEYREPLLLKALRGLSQREIADALELPETTIETRLARARRMLRTQLEADESRHTTSQLQRERTYGP